MQKSTDYTELRKTMDCVFCKIVQGKLPSTKIYESDQVLVFEDVYPSAELHFLVIPKTHIETFLDVDKKHADILLKMFDAAKKLVKKNNLKKYRLAINGGVLQEVGHFHLHLLGGDLTPKARKLLFNDSRHD